MATHPDPNANPCVRCGACCATYRVSFYWSEAAARGLPDALTEKLDPWMSCMAGTSRPAPRCVALRGTIGGEVACTVYAERPSPCRELQPGDDQCARARLRHGLPPLGADDVVGRTAA
jgi:Fe-S-cluster containining protein